MKKQISLLLTAVALNLSNDAQAGSFYRTRRAFTPLFRQAASNAMCTFATTGRSSAFNPSNIQKPLIDLQRSESFAPKVPINPQSQRFMSNALKRSNSNLSEIPTPAASSF